MYLYIMRHGETDWNREGRIQGSSDIALTDLGEELAEVTAEGFWGDGIRFDRIYTSPLIRAARTAEIIAGRDPDFCAERDLYVDDRLREMSFGKYEGLYLKECRQYDENLFHCFSKPSLYVADETGERYEDVFERIGDFTDQVLVPLEEIPEIKNVLVICHGTVIRAFLRCFMGIALDDFWKIRQPNCCINQFELADGAFSLVRENILYYDSEELKHRGIL